jgi:DNA-binding CsgD family transcriptional regulator
MADQPTNPRLGNIGAMLRAASTASTSLHNGQAVQHKREMVADLCRLLGHRVASVIPGTGDLPTRPSKSALKSTPALPALSPRAQQTLDLLLAGDSEKQIAGKLKLSRHTVHIYVKALYRGFGVSSRGELLSRFINRG